MGDIVKILSSSDILGKYKSLCVIVGSTRVLSAVDLKSTLWRLLFWRHQAAR